ncbi:type I-E CRISPR-associated protein Cas6/Cse3/CasE [Timonella sp. A28]|uniref:type I-E CRISPR-associated protein Cas6/Cse3/CasE n=1 Tax=Timonella sp. A28 TaxID=3442640 RepID=UPI003EB7FABD
MSAPMKLPEHPARIGEQISLNRTPVVAVGENIQASVLMVCQKTPPSRVSPEIHAQLKQGRAYRRKPVTVPEQERSAWVAKTFASLGLETEPDVTLSPLRTLPLGLKTGKIPAIHAQVKGVVTDSLLFNEALRTGVKSAKNYGFGLIRLT